MYRAPWKESNRRRRRVVRVIEVEWRERGKREKEGQWASLSETQREGERE